MDFKKQYDYTKIPIIHLGLLGGVSAMMAEIVTFPLDNIKTRIQMNGKQGLPTYTSTIDCVAKTLRSPGITGFYKGVSAALFRQATYSTVRMAVYEKMKVFLAADVEQVSFFRKLFSGGFAGAVGCIVGNPGDVLKIRLINDLAGVKYKGFFDAASQIIAQDGFGGFFKGLNVNIVRAVTVNAAELATYDHAKGFLVSKANLQPDHISTHFVASALAGLFAAIVSSPADVVKTRYMNQLKGGESYRGTIDCARSVYRNEGFLAFYKGFVPYFLRITPWTIVFFVAYEKTKYAYASLLW